MLRRAVFILTALLSLVVGGAVVYLLMSIPNDVQAETVLSSARADLNRKDRDGARQKLTTIVRDFPRTDAAAAASFALFRIADEENRELKRRLESLEKLQAAAAKKQSDSERKLEALAKVPPPAPPPPKVEPKPAPKQIIRRSTPTRRTTPARKTPTRRRRAELLDPQNLFPPSEFIAIMS